MNYINEVDLSMLSDIVYTKLSEQCLPDHLWKFADAVLSDEMLTQDILLHHRDRFSELHAQCKQKIDPFLQSQLQLHQHCSAYLLSRSYSLATINLKEHAQQLVAAIRIQWLDFCDHSTLPFSDCSK